jgi:hypothetical protein
MVDVQERKRMVEAIVVLLTDKTIAENDFEGLPGGPQEVAPLLPVTGKAVVLRRFSGFLRFVFRWWCHNTQPRKWDEFNEYYSNLDTSDEAVYKIGWYFWVCLDPEYPSNKSALSSYISFRAILFLLSIQEQYNFVEDDEYWPFTGKENCKIECMRNGRYVDELLSGIQWKKSPDSAYGLDRDR